MSAKSGSRSAARATVRVAAGNGAAQPAAHCGPEASVRADEWVGVGFRIGEEQFVADREQVREVLMLPDDMTRVPGRSAGCWVSPICAATCCRWSISS